MEAEVSQLGNMLSVKCNCMFLIVTEASTHFKTTKMASLFYVLPKYEIYRKNLISSCFIAYSSQHCFARFSLVGLSGCH